ncbi:histone-like nucleoid-structuring protein Lsr2 [Salana multivorans]
MVQKVSYVLIDDIDGGEAAESVTFGLDGVTYEIDLSADNAAKLREALAGWIGAARRSGGRRSTAAAKPRGRSGSDAAAIRVWAAANGHTVSPRGRIPAEIRAAYEAAN